ncbi:MAG: hypothetical protein ACON4T_04360 [Synechococcus sp.]
MPSRPKLVLGLLLPLLSLVAVGCGSPEVSLFSEEPEPFLPYEQPETDLEPEPAPSPLATLTPLPTTTQVETAVARGRVDPFAPLDAKSSDFTLQGVLAVGEQLQALVSTTSASGAICVGPSGRCTPDQTPLLPKDWSVLSIDPQQGCVTYAVNGIPQTPVCLDGSKA